MCSLARLSVGIQCRLERRVPDDHFASLVVKATVAAARRNLAAHHIALGIDIRFEADRTLLARRLGPRRVLAHDELTVLRLDRIDAFNRLSRRPCKRQQQQMGKHRDPPSNSEPLLAASPSGLIFTAAAEPALNFAVPILVLLDVADPFAAG